MELFKLLGTIAIEGADKAEKALDNVTGTAKKVQSTFAPVTKALGGAAVALGGAGVAATKMASDYDTAFAQVSTLLQGNEADLQKYKNDIIEASNETGKSAVDMSEAVYSAMSAGVDQANAVKFASDAVKLAKGGFTDTATAVDVLTSAINAYGLEAEDATHISDVLVTTQNLGKTTVGELASTMGKVIPTAKMMGVGIEQLGAGYATLTANAIGTAESTTYMNSMFNEMNKSGTTANGVLKEYAEKTLGAGASISDLTAKGYTVTDLLGVLNDSAKESGSSIKDMFGSAEAGTAAAVLIDNANQFTDSLDQMNNSANATEEAYNKMDQTLASKMEKMKTRFQNVGIELGEKLFPVVEKGMTWLEEHMPEIQANIDKLVPVISNLIQIVIEKGVPALTKVIEYVGKAVDWFVNLDDGQKKLIVTIGAVIAAISPVAGIIAGISTVLGVLAGAFSFLLSPIGLVVAAIAAVIAIGVALYKNWDTIKEKATDLKEKISETFGNIKDSIKEKIDSAKESVKKAIEKIKGFFKFEWSLPKLKLPHFKMKGEFSLNPLSVPSISVDWYKKAMDSPMIMNSPTAFGINKNGQIMAGGEAGSEVVSGTDTLMNMIASAVSAQNQALIEVLQKILLAILNMDEDLYKKFSDALESTSFTVNDREFGRLVRKAVL